MAYDKAVDSAKLDAGLTTIANTIRAKGGTSAPLEFPQGMADAVAAISGGGGENVVRVKMRKSDILFGNSGIARFAGEIDRVIIDFDNLTGGYSNMPNVKYTQMGDKAGGAIVDLINIPDADLKASDFFRHNSNVKEVNCIPKLYPTDNGRIFYQSDNNMKVTGVSLSRITVFLQGFATGIDIYWEDELMNDARFEFNDPNPQTVKRIIHLLHDYSAGPAHTLTLGDLASLLTPEEIQVANAKGWTIA